MTKHIRDHRGKNWFWSNNEIIDYYGPIVGAYGIAAYMVLARMADDTTQSCYPSYSTIAQRMKCSRPTAIKAVKSLEEVGLIDIIERAKDNSDNDSNIYTLLPLPPSKGDLLGGKSDIGGSQDDLLDPSKGDLPKQDSGSNKTKEQGDSPKKLNPRIAKAARLAYASLDPADQSYIARCAEMEDADIEATMWKYRDAEVARALKSSK